MGITVINWAPNELIGEDKMDQLGQNQQWLYDNTPRAMYSSYNGITKDTGIKIASGMAMIPPSKADWGGARVNFGSFFSVNCHPVITTGVYIEGQSQVYCVVNGLSSLQPDHRGFQTYINIGATKDANDKIASTVLVAWQAMGY